MSTPKTYILLKDLPDVKAGIKGKMNENGVLCFPETMATPEYFFDKETVNNNPKWFELIPEHTPTEQVPIKSIDVNIELRVLFNQVEYRESMNFDSTGLDKEKLWKEYMKVLDRLSKQPCKEPVFIPKTEPTEQITKERVEVIKVDYKRDDANQPAFYYEFLTDKEVWFTKFPSIKLAIERELNNDTVVEDIRDNKINLLEEDLWCVHKYLDDINIPRTDDNGKTYSIVGRIKKLGMKWVHKFSEIETEYLAQITRLNTAHQSEVDAIRKEVGNIRQECIFFGAEFAYYTSNPETKMDVPSYAYEQAEKYYNTKYKKRQPIIQQPISDNSLNLNTNDTVPEPKKENTTGSNEWEGISYEAKLWVVADLISRIYHYGNFKIETTNERTLCGILFDLGLFPTTEDIILMRPDIDYYEKRYLHFKLPTNDSPQTKKNTYPITKDDDKVTRDELLEAEHKAFYAAREDYDRGGCSPKMRKYPTFSAYKDLQK